MGIHTTDAVPLGAHEGPAGDLAGVMPGDSQMAAERTTW